MLDAEIEYRELVANVARNATEDSIRKIIASLMEVRTDTAKWLRRGIPLVVFMLAISALCIFLIPYAPTFPAAVDALCAAINLFSAAKLVTSLSKLWEAKKKAVFYHILFTDALAAQQAKA